MTQHRVTRKYITRSSGETFEQGDVFEPTQAELDAFGDRLEEVEEDDEFSMDQWLDQPYEERVTVVESGDVDEHLEEIIEHETSTQVEDAAEERMTEFGTAFSDDESDEEQEDEESED